MGGFERSNDKSTGCRLHKNRNGDIKMIKTIIIKDLGFWLILDCHRVSRLNLMNTLPDPQKLESIDFSKN